jgi:hypothetical protein
MASLIADDLRGGPWAGAIRLKVNPAEAASRTAHDAGQSRR